MAKKRLIPKLLLKRTNLGEVEKLLLVTTKNYSQYFPIGDPVSQARIYESQLADELIFIDLDQTIEKSDEVLKILQEISEEIFLPLTVGGGITSVSGFQRLLSNGADKVSINTSAVKNKKLIADAAEAFGAQCVVLSVDYKFDPVKNEHFVYIDGGRTKTDLHPIQWVKEAVALGAGEVLITSIDHDGMKEGMDLELLCKLSETVNVPIIASGGCGRTKHFIDGYQSCEVSALSAGTYFCFKDENPMQTRSQIKNAGIPIRIQT